MGRQVPSRWGMDKFKDDLHYYFLLAAIPLTLLTAYINITRGEAKLVPIPEGYKPKEVQRQMQIHGDYKGWYHREDIARYVRIQREGDRINTEQRGNHFVGHDHTPK